MRTRLTRPPSGVATRRSRSARAPRAARPAPPATAPRRSPSTATSRSRDRPRRAARSRTAPPTSHSPGNRPPAPSTAGPAGRPRKRVQAATSHRVHWLQSYPMSRGPRLRRWLPWVAGLGSMLLLARCRAGAHAAPPRRLESERRVQRPTRRSHRPPSRQPTQATREASFEWPVYGYSKQRTREFRLRDPSSLHPPYHATWAERGRVLLEFPPGARPPRAVHAQEQRRAVRAEPQAAASVLWKKKVGSLAASSPAYAHNTVYAVLLLALQGRAGRADHRARRQGRAGALVAQAAEPRGVLAAGRPRPRVLRHRGRHGLLAAARATARCAGATRPRGAVKGALAHGPQRQPVLRLLRRRRLLAARPRRQPALARRIGRRQHSTRPPPSPTAASTSATPTATSTRSAPRPAASPGATRTGGYVYGSPAVAHVPDGEADGLHRLLRQQALRARRAHRPRRAGRAAPRARSPAARSSSATSSSTRR